MQLSYAIHDIHNARQYYIEFGDLRSMILTALVADDDNDDDSSRSNSSLNNTTDKGVGSFYIENEAFYITAAGAA